MLTTRTRRYQLLALHSHPLYITNILPALTAPHTTDMFTILSVLAARSRKWKTRQVVPASSARYVQRTLLFKLQNTTE